MAKRTKNYIDNKIFYQAMTEHYDAVKKAKENNEELPQINNYIGECIYKIAVNTARRANFNNYTFKEEMIGDGIENAIRAVNNFDPSKSTQNPFAYFTRIIWFAFLRRIESEKKQLYTKHKVAENAFLSGGLFNEQSDSISKFQPSMNNTDYINDFVETYEKKLEEKKNK